MEDGKYLPFRLGYNIICILSTTCGAFSKIINKFCLTLVSLINFSIKERKFGLSHMMSLMTKGISPIHTTQ